MAKKSADWNNIRIECKQ